MGTVCVSEMASVSGSSSMSVRERQAYITGGRKRAVTVRVTPEQFALLKMRSLQEHMSVPRLLVECALNPAWQPAEIVEPDHVDAAPRVLSRREQGLAAIRDARELRNLLAALGSNLNQIARVANSTGEVGTEAVAAARAAKQAAIRVGQAVSAALDGRSS